MSVAESNSNGISDTSIIDKLSSLSSSNLSPLRKCKSLPPVENYAEEKKEKHFSPAMINLAMIWLLSDIATAKEKQMIKKDSVTRGVLGEMIFKEHSSSSGDDYLLRA
jgi:hypothetical protein